MKLQVIMLLIAKLFFSSGCATMPHPKSSLNDVEFTIFPYIVNIDNEYFLWYQIKLSENQALNLKRVVYCKIVENKAYYYFSIPISHPEKGEIVKIPLERDGITKFAKQDAVYWLNSDQSEVKLKIIKE